MGAQVENNKAWNTGNLVELFVERTAKTCHILISRFLVSQFSPDFGSSTIFESLITFIL